MRTLLASTVVMAVALSASPALAQTQLHTQPKDTTDRCANEDVSKMTRYAMWQCALDAIEGDNYAIQFKWYLAGAERGDWHAQSQVGAMYARTGSGGVNYDEHPDLLFVGKVDLPKPGLPPQDLVQGYKWREIASATYGQYVARQPPSTHPDDNSGYIRGRDEIAKKMTPEQIHEAQRLADDWLAANARLIEDHIQAELRGEVN